MRCSGLQQSSSCAQTIEALTLPYAPIVAAQYSAEAMKSGRKLCPGIVGPPISLSGVFSPMFCLCGAQSNIRYHSVEVSTCVIHVEKGQYFARMAMIRA